MSAYYFWSPTCGPCKTIKSAVDDLKEEFSSIEWHSVNTHADNALLTKKFGVTAVPTIVVVGASGTIERHSGTSMMGYYRILRNATRQ